jgi:hypothetical protein
LQNNLNRWYDPSVGRWLSEDPIGFAGRDANLYRYVRNQSTVRGDSRGLSASMFYTWYCSYKCSVFTRYFNNYWAACEAEYKDAPTDFASRYYNAQNVLAIVPPWTLAGLMLRCVDCKAGLAMDGDEFVEFRRGFQRCASIVVHAVNTVREGLSIGIGALPK